MQAAPSGSAEYCTVEGTTVTLAYSGVGRSSSTTSQADATYQAQLIADREAQADLLSVTPTGATPGACPAPAAVEPATVAPVLPATVPAEEPEAVAVPAPATVCLLARPPSLLVTDRPSRRCRSHCSPCWPWPRLPL